MAFFKPDEFLSSVAAIDLDALWESGVRCLLIDLDNTLLSRQTDDVPPFAREMIERARGKGFAIHLVSNNWHSSVFAQADRLGLPIIHKCMKPFPAAYIVARRRMGFSRRQSIAIGDQLMTDVVGAHLSGMKAILVLPLAKKDLKHTLLLRRIERVLMGGAKPTR